MKGTHFIFSECSDRLVPINLKSVTINLMTIAFVIFYKLIEDVLEALLALFVRKIKLSVIIELHIRSMAINTVNVCTLIYRYPRIIAYFCDMSDNHLIFRGFIFQQRTIMETFDPEYKVALIADHCIVLFFVFFNVLEYSHGLVDII